MQIENLKNNLHFIRKHQIRPVFVFGSDVDAQSLKSEENLYEIVTLDVEERYTNLYKKILLSLEYVTSFDYDFVIKIDDDTLVNFQKFETSFFNGWDYVGRFQDKFTKNTIDIDLPMYNIKQVIDVYPSSVFYEDFTFATGDFYVLSREAVSYIVSQKEFVFNTFKETDYVCEDQMIGFLLKDQTHFKTHDISNKSSEILNLKLQATRNNLSLHPINCHLFKQMINMDSEKQIWFLKNNLMMNLYYRENLLATLQTSIKNCILDFANSSKLMGLG